MIRNLAELRKSIISFMHGGFLRLVKGLSSPVRTIRAREGARISKLQQPDLGICGTYLVNVSERRMRRKKVGAGREEVTSKSLVLAPLIDWVLSKGAFI